MPTRITYGIFMVVMLFDFHISELSAGVYEKCLKGCHKKFAKNRKDRHICKASCDIMLSVNF